MPCRLPFFPAPYPDESWYSILCRYHVRIGGAYPYATMRTLFGAETSLSGFLLLPRRLDLLDTWLSPDSLITRESVTDNHSCYGWLSPALSISYLDEFENSLLAGKSNLGLEAALSIKAAVGGQHAFLRFCPECALNDIKQYGETYWHRLPQLPGIEYCPAHCCRIQDSNISVKQIKRDFFPASCIIRDCRSTTEGASAQLYQEKYQQIANDTKWLLQNGRKLGGSERIARIYRGCLIDKGLPSIHTDASTTQATIGAFIEFHDETFVHRLIPGDKELKRRLSYAPRINPSMPLLYPLLHILMMEFLAGSVEAFSSLSPRSTPYGDGPWPCINRVCPNYGDNQAKIIGVSEGYRRTYTHFKCDTCGMTYRRSDVLQSFEEFPRDATVLEYGPLWDAKLRECIEVKHMSVTKACQVMDYNRLVVRKRVRELGLSPPRK